MGDDIFKKPDSVLETQPKLSLEDVNRMGPRDFNNVKVWLTKKLAERGVSTNRFTQLTGDQITTASLFRWYNDTFRPSEQKMRIVCDTLSKLPILKEGEPPRFEHVPLSEGMAQFSETQRSDRLRKR